MAIGQRDEIRTLGTSIHTGQVGPFLLIVGAWNHTWPTQEHSLFGGGLSKLLPEFLGSAVFRNQL